MESLTKLKKQISKILQNKPANIEHFAFNFTNFKIIKEILNLERNKNYLSFLKFKEY